MRSAGRVLVLDDDPAIREVLEAALRAEGYAVETAPDAGTALDWLNAQATTGPALIYSTATPEEVQAVQNLSLIHI